MEHDDYDLMRCSLAACYAGHGWQPVSPARRS
jgi:hypothetical protein